MFSLAEKFQIQIFATSHSQEMIRAFNRVGNRERNEGMAMYFEMARHFKTGAIILNPMDAEMLHHELVSDNPFRGE